MTVSRENILNKIKQALKTPVPAPFPAAADLREQFYTAPEEEAAIGFAQRFTALGGRFSFCTSEKELATQLNMLFIQRQWSATYCREPELKASLQEAGFVATTATDLDACDASITGCEYLVARTGSILLSSAQASGRTVSVYAPIHICIAYTDQLVFDIGEGLQLLRDEYGAALPSLITLATGPSRTADIEKTLVVGVHGPKEVFCFLVERS